MSCGSGWSGSGNAPPPVVSKSIVTHFQSFQDPIDDAYPYIGLTQGFSNPSTDVDTFSNLPWRSHYAIFPPSSTSTQISWCFPISANWDGGDILGRIFWKIRFVSAAADRTFELALSGYSDLDDLDGGVTNAFSNSFTDLSGADDDLHITDQKIMVMQNSPIPGDLMFSRIRRNDSASGDVRMIGVEYQYSVNLS